jgi:hypothetical protein
MVLLTLTSAAKSAVELYNQHSHDASLEDASLSEPVIGGPISHAQLITVARFLRDTHAPSNDDFRLDILLKGASIYVPPPKPKPQPVNTFPHVC